LQQLSSGKSVGPSEWVARSINAYGGIAVSGALSRRLAGLFRPLWRSRCRKPWEWQQFYADRLWS